MTELVTVVAWCASFALIFVVTVATSAAIRRKQAERIRRELLADDDSTCTCGHGYYAHAHHMPYKPCATLMCSCPEFRSTTKENP